MTKKILFALTAIAPLAFAAALPSGARAAEETAIATAAPEAPATVEELVINPGVTFRDRTDTTAPVLVYDQEYFQRFEPVSAGDAMKRVPSVTFLSDVEYPAPDQPSAEALALARDADLLIHDAMHPDADYDLHGSSTNDPEKLCPGVAGYSTTHDDCDDGTVLRRANGNGRANQIATAR